MKHDYVGTDYQPSEKHPHRYANEFVGRHNQRPLDSADQMASTMRRWDGKRLEYATLTADPLLGTVSEPGTSQLW